MKFTVATVAALAVGAQASYAAGNVTYTTEVVTAYTTYCPAATQVTYGGKTYTITEATTLTITDCPCTVSKPVYTTSSVICSTCTSAAASSSTAAASSSAPVYPTNNGTTVASTSTVKATGGQTTTKASATASTTASSVPTAAAGKLAALSGAGLAGLVGLAAFL
ncbi:hypothetical protein BKA67DRAFT_243782 [Truncatella angustata]|uniref:Clock-controlled protein 6 n=1 Tax=Truncatella angustata TaxID=152316 RepID=A0A9P8UP13_9PEZI|nr:uncharacterized protein BKA67DRAFT_243782 [Truncatella angustata]KAH6655618.1 hypothetical protein BKA67DRAFT_243782 [Truncatella angustata]KAH8194659.1 hypothetical protein TruAng_011177 [Truncatella angustata]